MIPHLFYYQLIVLGLLWLCVMLHYAWPSRGVAAQQRPATPITPRRQRSKEPQPFAGLPQKPHCALCDQEAPRPKLPPPLPPDPMHPTKRRPRVIDTSRHFCPHGNCRYRGWLGAGNLQANGHPSGGPWRQFHCTACKGYFLETHGTLFHGKRGSVEIIVRVIARLAEGLGIRGTARVFEVDPNTVLHWLLEAADHLQAFSGVSHLLHTKWPSHLRALLYKIGNVEGEVLDRLIDLNVVLPGCRRPDAVVIFLQPAQQPHP
jgi:transposase-like protein